MLFRPARLNLHLDLLSSTRISSITKPSSSIHTLTSSSLRTQISTRESTESSQPPPPLISSSSTSTSKGRAMSFSTTSTPSYPSFSTQNFYSGSNLNRLSWLRTDSDFLNSALTSDKTRFLLLENLNPLVDSQTGFLKTLSWKQVDETIVSTAELAGLKTGQQDGNLTLFGSAGYGLKPTSSTPSEKELERFDKNTQGLNPSTLALVFLGIDESDLDQTSLPGELASLNQIHQKDQDDKSTIPAGTPYFALSLTYRPPNLKDSDRLPTQKLLEELKKDEKLDFVDTRTLASAGTWKSSDAALVAQARSLIDWNERNVYCPACSRRQYSLWAGYKRGCSFGLSGAETSNPDFVKPFLEKADSFKDDGKIDCPSTRMLSNFCYPRTDPVVIMAILSSDKQSILLGRQKKWPKRFFSCLAGFLECGESLEEAVRREVLEESGLKVSEVFYHSSQSWPFPSQLMMGAIGIVEKGQEDKIRLDLDNELEIADWFSKEDVLNVLEKSGNVVFSKKDLAGIDENEKEKMRLENERKEKEQGIKEQGSNKWNEKDEGSVANVSSRSENDDKLKFKLPGPTAIAHVLISAWAKGSAIIPTGGDVENSVGKGRM